MIVVITAMNLQHAVSSQPQHLSALRSLYPSALYSGLYVMEYHDSFAMFIIETGLIVGYLTMCMSCQVDGLFVSLVAGQRDV